MRGNLEMLKVATKFSTNHILQAPQKTKNKLANVVWVILNFEKRIKEKMRWLWLRLVG